MTQETSELLDLHICPHFRECPKSYCFHVVPHQYVPACESVECPVFEDAICIKKVEVDDG